ncbi:actin-like ATPase domain-containing protein [Aureobasidium namibiae CBS 147.97]|uniref:Actin-like ATPase domain-containing protein n=1 Tax=Aureobasidium namibiae CBS 147.97 TaxID=1043004 RepID=A0A074W5V5_9PEZI|nr:actin-like ATPase domain-containing protein [Aureobasidium namibiae CBS 147.97]KEQ68243.1 actin-like ATPase domain-containing protein [Aureobasidium namibiae CBS 147.97]
MQPSDLSQDRLIVGLDFGTTFSGCAFTYGGSQETADEIEVITNWPGSNNITSEKVPSELMYESAPSGAGVKRTSSGDPIIAKSPRWGFQIKPNESRLRCMKLLLDRHQKFPSYVSRQDLGNLLVHWDKSAEQAVSDYLTALYSHVKKRFEKRFPLMVATTQIDIVITVPAVWSDAAKDATMRAATNAGMGTNLFMVSEPEAAAIYAIKSIDIQKKLCMAGDNFIVCDCGGGTVDLASFEVSSVSPLRLKESAPGIGALCGSVFLNLKFQDLVRRRMGAEEFQTFCRKSPSAWTVAHKYFEDYVKRNFDPMDSEAESDDSQFHVPFPGVPDNLAAGIVGSFITLTNADVSEIFRPLVDKVIVLIERQRNVLAAHDKSAKGLILVGGFGASNYLYRCLKTRFADEDPPPTYTPSAQQSEPAIEEGPRFIIMQPEHSWTAVVRGAVLAGRDKDLVVSRKARRHYGVLCSEEWDPSRHSLKNRSTSRITKELRATNQINWYVVRGQNMPSDEPVLIEMTEDFLPCERQGSASSVEIIVSDAEVPPQEYEPTTDTRILCTLSTDPKPIPAKYYKKRVAHGQTYFCLGQQFGMTFNGRLVFDQRIDGTIYSSVQAVYT